MKKKRILTPCVKQRSLAEAHAEESDSDITAKFEINLFRNLTKAFGTESAFFFKRSELTPEGFEPSQTVFCIDPIEVIRVRGEDPLKVLAERLSEYDVAEYKDFQYGRAWNNGPGGALGYLSYDSVRFFEPILTQAKTAQKLNQYDGEFMIFKKIIVMDHRVQSAFFVELQEKTDSAEVKLQGVVELEKIYLQTLVQTRELSKNPTLVEIKPEPLAPESMSPMQGKVRFTEKVLKLKEHIKEGDIFQAVLSEKFKTPYDGSPIDLFEALCEQGSAPYQFCFLTEARAYMGCSPEMLLQVNEGELETHPIAGTRPRGTTFDEETRFTSQLLRSPKEKAEHLMLVDLSRNDLGRVSAPGTVRVEVFQKIRKFAGVMHLVSVVKGTLKQIRPTIRDSLEALAACFPAGTLSGAPKIRAMQLLLELEPEPRGFYGGAVIAAGFGGDIDSCISIRSIQLEKEIATIQAGAGIVADSSPEREYEEILHKTKASRQALALAICRIPQKVGPS